MKTLGQKIRELRSQHDLSQVDFAKILGISNSTLSQYESDDRIPKDPLKLKIADYFGVSVDYLLGRDSSPTPQPKTNSQFITLHEPGLTGFPKTSPVKIPVVGRVGAGFPLTAIQDIIDYEEIPAEMAKTGEFFGLKISGQSMEPRILDGDVVIVRKQEEVENEDIAIVMINDNDGTCKKFTKHENGISLASFNPPSPKFYTTEECEKLPIRIIGKVVELRGKF